MRTLAFVLVCCSVAWPQEEDRLRALERRVAALEEENAELARKVEELEEKLAASPFQHGRRPKVKHLEGVELPEGATKDQVRTYVGAILEPAQRKNTFSTRDPEVDHLRRVGSANVDVLIDALADADWVSGDLYLIEALKGLVGEEHKQMVLDDLPRTKDLVKIVLARRWTEDAAPTLLGVLAKGPEYVPTEWIEAVAKLQRRESYASLESYLARGSNPWHTWKAIRDLPDMDVAAAVAKAWEGSRSRPWERGQLAAVAAHYGHLDALEVVIDGLEDDGIWQAAEVIRDLTPYRGPDDGAAEWFEANRGKLVFDAAAKRYKVQAEKAAPTER